MQDAIRLKKVKNSQEISTLLAIRNFLKTMDVKPQSLIKLEQQAYL